MTESNESGKFQPGKTEEMIDDFIAECEKEAAKLEITVDYYLAEFV